MQIRDNVKLLCKTFGITQKELAAKIGMKENTFNIILGKGNPQLSTLQKIAGGFGITVSDLLAEGAVTPPQQDAPQPRQEHTAGQGIFCPHCGGRITLYVRAEDTTDPSPQPDTAGNTSEQEQWNA